MNKLIVIILSVLISTTLTFVGCSKGGGGTTPPPNPCASKTIVVAGTTTSTTTPTAANGSISASATGSSGFTFSLNGGAFQASGTFTGLAVGSYTITAKDGDACTGSQSFSVTATPCPTITVTATLTQTSSPTATNGSITATGAGSTGFTYNINGGTFQASGTFNNLAVGSYTISARDANGCIGSNSFTVSTVSCPTILVTANVFQTSTHTTTNGAIFATASGSTGFTYSRNGINFQANGSFNNLGVGTYIITAKDVNGCIGSASFTVTAAACPILTANLSTTFSVKCESNTGTITIVGSDGVPPYTYSKDGGITFQSSILFQFLAVGNYNMVCKDVNGCTTNRLATVGEAPVGFLFTQVKAVLAANCATPGCHALPSPQNGLNFADDCTIVSQALRIKARAVDANPSVMPPTGLIPAIDRQKIVDWINAGGKHNN